MYTKTVLIICIPNVLCCVCGIGQILNRFASTIHATGLFLYPLKSSENVYFSDVFRGYRKRPVVGNGLRT